MSKTSAAIIHGLKVLAHIAISVFLLGLVTYFGSHESMPAWFTNGLTHFGVPMAIVNVIWAGIYKAATHIPVSIDSIDSLPGRNPFTPPDDSH